MAAHCPIFPRKRPISARRNGRSRRFRKIWKTGASRSPGPVERKMVINALNSGANVFMADFEDSNSPTWQNNIEGQINLRDAIDGTHRLIRVRKARSTRWRRRRRCCWFGRAAGI